MIILHIMMSKNDLRQQLRNQRNQLTHDRVQKLSAVLCDQVMGLEVYQKAQALGCYVSVGCEANTHALLHHAIANDKQVTVPITLGKGQMAFQRIGAFADLKPARFGLLEPAFDQKKCISPESLDLMLVPGVVFDRCGHRIGLGGGYYDRFLIQTPAVRVGLAFDFQVVEAVPFEMHDVPMDFIVTEREVVRCHTQKT